MAEKKTNTTGKPKPKVYIFKVLSGNPSSCFVGKFNRKRYKFDSNCLSSGNATDLKNLQSFVDRGLIQVYEGGLLEDHVPESKRTPQAQLKVLVAQAKDVGLKEFNGKPIEECNADELAVALKTLN